MKSKHLKMPCGCGSLPLALVLLAALFLYIDCADKTGRMSYPKNDADVFGETPETITFHNKSQADSGSAALENPNERFWGTWRPNLYFGVRARHPNPPISGLMWRSFLDQKILDIRHDCTNDFKNLRFGYDIHNGDDYAQQTLEDSEANVRITTEWVFSPAGIHGGEWVARIKGEPISEIRKMHVSLMYYFAKSVDADKKSDGKKLRCNFKIPEDLSKRSRALVHGCTAELGDFSAYVTSDEIKNASFMTLSTPPEISWGLKTIFQKNLRDRLKALSEKRKIQIQDLKFANGDHRALFSKGSVFLAELTFEKKFSFDISFVSHSAHKSQTFEDYDALRTGFDELAKKFKIQAAQKANDFLSEGLRTLSLTENLLKSAVETAKLAFSSLMGGVGYFYGDSIINSAPDDEEKLFRTFEFSEDEDEVELEEQRLALLDKRKNFASKTEPTSLFTATPSRSFFPRGFLWDEGFHLLVLLRWNKKVAMESMRSWFSQMNEDGWIAREQILGDEARSKVPKEFLEQRTTIANPPALFLAIEKILRLSQPSSAEHGWSPQQANATERAKVLTAFLHEIYPLAAKHLNWIMRTQDGDGGNYGRGDEMEGLVFRWRGRQIQHNFASGLDDYPRSNPPHTGELHVDLTAWVCYANTVMEGVAKHLGKEKDALEYGFQWRKIHDVMIQHFWNDEYHVYADLVPSADERSSHHFIMRGYVSLLPWLLMPKIPKDQLPKFFDLLNELSCEYGVRSLSPNEKSFYGQGENYWRSDIWINFQYLVLRSLHKHSRKNDCSECQDMYAKLRKQIVKNVVENFEKHGSIFETYSPVDGHGQRSHPFTGWSSLIALIIAEDYL